MAWCRFKCKAEAKVAGHSRQPWGRSGWRVLTCSNNSSHPLNALRQRAQRGPCVCRHCRMCFFKWAGISKLFSQTPHWCSLVEVPAIWVLESGTLLPFASFLSSPHSSVPSPAEGFRYNICWLSNFTADRVTCLPGNDLWPDLFCCLVSDMPRHWGWVTSQSSSNSGSTNLQPFTSGSASSTLHTGGGGQSRAI